MQVRKNGCPPIYWREESPKKKVEEEQRKKEEDRIIRMHINITTSECDIYKCTICGKSYQKRHMFIGPDVRCIICFQRYEGYPRDKLDIKKTYNFIKKYLIEHYLIHDKYNHLEKYSMACANPDKLDEIVFNLNTQNEQQHETTPIDISVVSFKQDFNKESHNEFEQTLNLCPPLSIGGDEQTNSGISIDTEIAALVAEMNRVGIHTTCSCQGHDGGEAYISIRLGDGTTYGYRKDIFGPDYDELILKWRRKK